MDCGNRNAGDKHLRNTVASTFQKQHGLITRSQLLSLGFTPSRICRWAAGGKLDRIFPGVFASPAAPRTWDQKTLATCFYAGPRAAASHRCAARLHNLEGFETARVEITAPKRLGIRPFNAVVHYRPSVTDRDVRRIRAIPVTCPERTLLDLASVADTDVVERALEDALRRGLTSLQRLRATVAAHSRSRTAGVRPLRSLLELRGEEPATESYLETRFLQFARNHGLPVPSRQHVPAIASTWRPRFDFAYPSHKVAIEVDGFRHHSGRSAWRHDRMRLSATAAAGWRVIHVTHEDLRAPASQTKAEEIRRALGLRRV